MWIIRVFNIHGNKKPEICRSLAWYAMYNNLLFISLDCTPTFDIETVRNKGPGMFLGLLLL
jgi:hypothetical protein